MDMALIAHRCNDSRKRETKQRLVWKIDIEKTYYQINWDFLLHFLGGMALEVSGKGDMA